MLVKKKSKFPSVYPAAAGSAFSGPPRKALISTTRALPVGRRMPDTGSPIRYWDLVANRGGETNQCASTLWRVNKQAH